MRNWQPQKNGQPQKSQKWRATNNKKLATPKKVDNPKKVDGHKKWEMGNPPYKWTTMKKDRNRGVTNIQIWITSSSASILLRASLLGICLLTYENHNRHSAWICGECLWILQFSENCLNVKLLHIPSLCQDQNHYISSQLWQFKTRNVTRTCLCWKLASGKKKLKAY